jgi:hypothetical protein
MSKPIVSPGQLTWDASLDVPFKVAGLGKNNSLTVKLTAQVNLDIAVSGGGAMVNSVNARFGLTNPPGLVFPTLSVSGNSIITTEQFLTTATLTSDKNGQVTGTLTIPGDINGTIPDNSACARVSWKLIKLTFGNKSVALPDVSGEFDSTGSVCQ